MFGVLLGLMYHMVFLVWFLSGFLASKAFLFGLLVSQVFLGLLRCFHGVYKLVWGYFFHKHPAFLYKHCMVFSVQHVWCFLAHALSFGSISSVDLDCF